MANEPDKNQKNTTNELLEEKNRANELIDKPLKENKTGINPCYTAFSVIGRNTMRFRRSTPYEGSTAGYIVYEVIDGLVYALRTPHSRASKDAEYTIRGNFLYRTRYHTAGYSKTPDYEIREGKLYRTPDHRWGPKTTAEFDVVV